MFRLSTVAFRVMGSTWKRSNRLALLSCNSSLSSCAMITSPHKARHFAKKTGEGRKRRQAPEVRQSQSSSAVAAAMAQAAAAMEKKRAETAAAMEKKRAETTSSSSSSREHAVGAKATPFVFGELVEKLLPTPRPYEESVGYQLEQWRDRQKQYFGFSQQTSKIFRHFLIFCGSVLLSSWLGATFSMGSGNNVPTLIENFDELMALLYEEQYSDKLEHALQLVADAAFTNDTLKAMIMATPADMARLFTLASSPDYSAVVRNFAVKIIDNVTQLPDNQSLAAERGYISRLSSLIQADNTPLYVIKTAAYALCNIAENEKTHVQLVREGGLRALQTASDNPYTARQSIRGAMSRIATTVHHLEEQAGGSNSVSPADRAHVDSLARAAKDLQNNKVYTFKSAVMESGTALYVHTVLGGAVWGCVTSLRNKAPPAVFATNVMRTAFVTGVVPAYFVGACVSLFQHYHRKMDTHNELFTLYTMTILSTFHPWFYLLPMVERWAPLWLGGHVVGFMSFFTYLRLTDADVLKSDAQLKIRDGSFKA
mmetsp:Transcript_50697/g.99308  ORF Transcript_50697/g.99308 Transcript_50697/m.99308 type:complete len:540 (-) Transcript_50697:163-1782(-)